MEWFILRLIKDNISIINIKSDKDNIYHIYKIYINMKYEWKKVLKIWYVVTLEQSGQESK